MDDSSGQSLDPFEFHGYPASCIAGLGGSLPVPDPSYAFHTPYVPVARGHAHFLIRFTNLEARRGSLVLRVHMLPDEPGAVAQLVTSHRLQLNWLAHRGGETQLRFEAFRGARYALMGIVPDQLDASATNLAITLDRPATEDDLAAPGMAAESQSTAYGSETIRSASAALILSLDPPSFAHPVSQPCTAKQVREPEFRNRVKALGNRSADRATLWESAYAVQALDRYGMLQPGARGLILGRNDPAIAATLAAAGASCRHVSFDPVDGADGSTIDPTALPEELFAFDFLLSIRSTDTMSSDKVAAAFIEHAMECLRPQGLAVHILSYHPSPSSLSTVAFDRNGVERIALALISRGHQMARMKPALVPHKLESGADTVVPYGLIARRAIAIR